MSQMWLLLRWMGNALSSESNLLQLWCRAGDLRGWQTCFYGVLALYCQKILHQSTRWYYHGTRQGEERALPNTKVCIWEMTRKS